MQYCMLVVPGSAILGKMPSAGVGFEPPAALCLGA